MNSKTNRKTHRSVTRHVANPRANAPHRAVPARHAHTAHTATHANTATHEPPTRVVLAQPSRVWFFARHHTHRHAPSMRASMSAMTTRMGGTIENRRCRCDARVPERRAMAPRRRARGVRRPNEYHIQNGPFRVWVGFCNCGGDD